jgi:tRNA (guanine37-N1)-methyltransferase
MRFDVVTLFPQMFAPMLEVGINRRALSAQGDQAPLIDLRLHDLRNFGEGQYRRVDDRPFGGGPGMVMLAEPLAQCVDGILAERGASVPVILFSPLGNTLAHTAVTQWATSDGAILICGRYEGVDQRFIDAYVTDQISLGDFVLSGGEIAAMAFVDAIARLQPGVLGDAQSHAQDSFNPAIDGLLDCPHYTRPPEWRGQAVPAVLQGGNHAAIEAWRMSERQRLTAAHRPDLLAENQPIKNDSNKH